MQSAVEMDHTDFLCHPLVQDYIGNQLWRGTEYINLKPAEFNSGLVVSDISQVSLPSQIATR